MWNPQTMELMPGFWPPKPNRFWNAALAPLRHYYLRRYYGITQIRVDGIELIQSLLDSHDGVLLAPNHSNDSDPHVMIEVGHRIGRQLYFMAAWQVFKGHGGIDGRVMQRFGAFSVDREGCDRRAMRQATELLTAGQSLVVFPEGEIYHTSERLTPLREGVAFMAVTAQRELEKSKSAAQVWVAPTAIRYKYDDDITPNLELAMTALEQRMLLRTPAGTTLPQRIIRFGEAMLTLKEKEILGRAHDDDPDLPARLKRVIDSILGRLETEHFHKNSPADSVPLRAKTLRHSLLEIMCDDKASDDARRAARAALDDLHLVLQLYSYPGDYVAGKPSVERMAETVEKFEEDILGAAKPKGTRSATVTFGEPLDVKRHTSSRTRVAAGALTGRLETAIRGLLTSG